MMCGIAGWFGGVPGPRDKEILDGILHEIVHRGPDGGGQYQTTSSAGDRVALGHRRLAIIDLGGGVQPMSTKDMSHVISYNGELYNYKDLREELIRCGETFRTDSDTEVVLRAYMYWGDRCFEKFRGMFALAIWDAANDRLVLARDQFGKKPLYYTVADGVLIFSSELSSIISHPACSTTLDGDSIYEYLRFRYVPSPHTFVSSIKKLPPGHYLSKSSRDLRVERFFLPIYQDPKIKPVAYGDSESEEVFLNLLEESVKLRMQSDVPYGAFLSGGIDSAAIVALMARNSDGPIKTFSIGFREERYSELSRAKLVADTFKTQHHEIMVNYRDIMGHLESLTRNRCAPIAETADIPIYILSKFAAQDVKVVLSGEGSDELLAGYPKHGVEPWIAGREWLLSNSIVREAGSKALDLLPGEKRRIRVAWEAITEGSFKGRMASWFGSFSERTCAEFLLNCANRRCLDDVPFSARTQWSNLRRILHFDQTSWLPDNLLERGDRMTMAASLEARMPFMDIELARFVATLPDNALLRNGTTKYILRKCMRPLLPSGTISRSKIGFRVPVDEWFRGDLKEFVSDHICDGNAKIARFIDISRVRKIVAYHQDRARNYEKQIWALLSLEFFLRIFRL